MKADQLNSEFEIYGACFDFEDCEIDHVNALRQITEAFFFFFLFQKIYIYKMQRNIILKKSSGNFYRRNKEKFLLRMLGWRKNQRKETIVI